MTDQEFYDDWGVLAKLKEDMAVREENERLQLLAENYRAILAGLINSSDRGDTGSDSSYARYWAEARQALSEDGK